MAQAGRFLLVVDAIALGIAGLLALLHASIARGRPLDSFALIVFLEFLAFLIYALLSGPGFFLARPRFAPMNAEGRGRWRRWLTAPPIGADREFFDLVFWVAAGFVLLVLGTAIGQVARLLGG